MVDIRSFFKKAGAPTHSRPLQACPEETKSRTFGKRSPNSDRKKTQPVSSASNKSHVKGGRRRKVITLDDSSDEIDEKPIGVENAGKRQPQVRASKSQGSQSKRIRANSKLEEVDPTDFFATSACENESSKKKKTRLSPYDSVADYVEDAVANVYVSVASPISEQERDVSEQTAVNDSAFSHLTKGREAFSDEDQSAVPKSKKTIEKSTQESSSTSKDIQKRPRRAIEEGSALDEDAKLTKRVAPCPEETKMKPKFARLTKERQDKSTTSLKDEQSSKDPIKPRVEPSNSLKVAPKRQRVANKNKAKESNQVGEEYDTSLPQGVTVQAESAWQPRSSTFDIASAEHSDRPLPSGPPHCLEGLCFVFTGQMKRLQREDGEDLVKKHGARVTKSVSSKTSFLVAGLDSGKSKIEKAHGLKIKVINEDMLFDLIEKNIALSQSHSKSTSKSPIAVVKSHQRAKLSQQQISHPNPEQAGMLWVDKYAPKTVKDLVGNKAVFDKMRAFLTDWKPVQAPTLKTAQKNAILLSGPPGIGKSTSASLCGREAGYDVVELNASDTRSKKQLQNVIEECAHSHSVKEFYSSSATSGSVKKTLLIMDEVDGCSAGDRGGIAELISVIKSTRIPIICICNDRQSTKIRSLAGWCMDLRFRRPQAQQVLPRLRKICEQENLRVDDLGLSKLAESARGDIRQMVNTLGMWSRSTDQLGSYDEAKERLSSANKDQDVGIWEAVPDLFRIPHPQDVEWVASRSQVYFEDSALVPLFVFENYMRVSGHKTLAFDLLGKSPPQIAAHSLRDFVDAAEFISCGDCLDAFMRKDMTFSMMPAHAIMSSVAPAFYANGGVGRLQFPAWLGKNSTQNKQYRIVADIRIAAGAPLLQLSPSFCVLDYFPAMALRLTNPLLERGDKGIDDVLQFMECYGVDRETFNLILEFSQAFNADSSTIKLSTSVKSALTRRYNSSLVAKQSLQGKGRRRKKSVASELMKLDDDGDEYIDENDEDEIEIELQEDMPKQSKARGKKGNVKR